MSLEAVLKNICSFLELLQKARNSKSLNWSADSFRNAFQWAEYCEKIYYQSLGKPYEGQLNEEIKKLNCLPWTLGSLIVDLNLLKNSIGWLAMALIQNANSALSDSKKKYIWNKVSQNDFLKNNLEEFVAMNDLFKDIVSFKTLGETYAVLSDSRDEIFSIEQLKVETLATLLIDYVQKISSLAFSDDLMQRMFLREKLQELASSRTGLTVIIQAYLILFESMKKELRNARKHLDSFISSLITKADISFWDSLPRRLVMDLCATNEDYLTKLFQDLDRLSTCFEVDYRDGFVIGEDGRISLYSWRFVVEAEQKKPCMPVVSYQWLREWVDPLLRGDDASVVGKASADIVSRLAKSSQVNIWRTMCQELDRCDLLMDDMD